MQTRNLFFCALAAAAGLAAGSLPYAGKWKMNPAKSDLRARTVTFESLPSGEWQETYAGQSYKFKMDGNDYPDGFGGIAVWKAIDANTWEMISKVNGKVITTDTLNLAADGSLLTIIAKGTKVNGEPIDQTTTFQRVAGGPGLAGKWKTTNVKNSSPAVIEFSSSGSNGLTYRAPAMELTCEGKLDGKDYPCTGPALPPGWTLAMTKAGMRPMDMMVKKDSKPFFKATYMVASGGKSLIETGGATATNENFKVVYDRQ